MKAINMKPNSEIQRIEHCFPPKFIEVKNYDVLNKISTFFWYNKHDITKDYYSIGCWHIKPKQQQQNETRILHRSI